MKNIQLMLLGLLTMAVMPQSYADNEKRYSGQSEFAYAEVVEVEPLIRYVRVEVPRRECWDEEVYHERRRRNYKSRSNHGSAGATIAGGLIGGVIGRQIGGGSGRDAMTVVGTLVGSAIANERSRDRDRYEDDRDDGYSVRTVERCKIHKEVREEERVDGYRVTYVYDGREYTTRTEDDPGDRIKVRVSVTPAGY